MKLVKSLLIGSVLVTTLNVFAQEQEQEQQEYNKWSIEANLGTAHLTGLITNAQFRNSAFAPIGFNVGARRMFNNKFGAKFEFGYDILEGRLNNSFEAKMMHVNVNGVLNLGQILDFQQFTNRFSILMNVGFGYSRLNLNEDLATDSYVKNNNGDNMLNAKVGFTLQTRINDKLVFNLDASQRYLAVRNLNLDGSKSEDAVLSRIDGGVLNFTAGLTYYLGKNEKHSDWKPFEVIPDLTNELEELQQKLAEVQDAAVTKRELDALKKELESKLDSGVAKAAEKAEKAVQASNSSTKDIPEYLMNNDYMAAYFDFNKRTPTNVSTNGIDFLVTYMRKNPNTKVTLFGYADEVGNSEYNKKLAKDRAESVKRVMLKAGISEDRISIKSGGEDNSVDPKSAEARTLVRRVVFRINQ